ncbi:uncharacterized protein [Rutidosis leptorrhynchoides]|uniref:uncharacterized protein n=1 Tax=Rutidosis leptorrhynchoides TaxID=125765 RepID=UPI003A997EE8
MSYADRAELFKKGNNGLITYLGNLTFWDQILASSLPVLEESQGSTSCQVQRVKTAPEGIKNLLNHLTSSPPESDDPSFEKWEQVDLVVFSWLIQNIEPNLASNLTEFPTAKALWDALVTTYSSGKDKLQNFDLHVKENDIKQENMSISDLWITMQGIWGEIDRRDPNPMKCSTEIVTYNRIRAEQKLFQFLNALDSKHDTIKRELLRLEPLPTTKESYATVRKEIAHQLILGQTNHFSQNQSVAFGLAATNQNKSLGLAASSNRHPTPRIDKSKLKCTRCGRSKHTIDQCFEIKGYREWWSKPSKNKATNYLPPCVK